MPTKNKKKAREASRRHYQNNKDAYKARNAKKRAEIKEFLRQAKDKPCADCGQTFPPYVMDFDHREPSEKTYQMACIYREHSWRKIHEELAKCDVVCANCHRERTFGKKAA